MWSTGRQSVRCGVRVLRRAFGCPPRALPLLRVLPSAHPRWSGAQTALLRSPAGRPHTARWRLLCAAKLGITPGRGAPATNLGPLQPLGVTAADPGLTASFGSRAGKWALRRWDGLGGGTRNGGQTCVGGGDGGAQPQEQAPSAQIGQPRWVSRERVLLSGDREPHPGPLGLTDQSFRPESLPSLEGPGPPPLGRRAAGWGLPGAQPQVLPRGLSTQYS